MKKLLLAVFGCLFLSCTVLSFQVTKECASGPGHWCQNFNNAVKCNAVNHCYQTVWEKKAYPVDNDSVCQICKDMVGQARDQLRSNETEEELEEVLEGMCYPIKKVKKVYKQCTNVADDFALQLVDILSSQMDPNIVCSAAGLCNNAEIRRLMALEAAKPAVAPVKSAGLSCSQCNKVSKIITRKFRNTDRDQVLEQMLLACRGLSSFTDGCSAYVLSYFNDIYNHLTTNLNAENICHLSGTCSSRFHEHEEDKNVEVVADSEIGVINRKGDDIPCDLCKQLVVHLRDLLVTNTTEAEFKKVLDGLCRQTGTFSDTCESLADQYFKQIYEALQNDLDPENACFMIGICPKGLSALFDDRQSIPIRPLVPIKQLLVKKKLLGEDEPHYTAEEIQQAQLPIDRLILDTVTIEKHTVGKNPQFCTLCEYFLHFVQDALASPKNEENIKNTVLNSCHKLPKAIQGECQEFVDTYGDAVIALLIQDLDPATICPKLSLCTSAISVKADGKCPLCLFLVQDLEDKLKHNKTKANIENELHTLCSHLRDDLKAECFDFVNTYTAELVDKLANDFSPHDICSYLKLCPDNEMRLIDHLGSKATLLQYKENSVYEVTFETETARPECILCEQLVKDIEKKATKEKSRDSIKKFLEEACSAFPKTKLKNKCQVAIEKNADLLINLILKEVTPKEVCTVLGFCGVPSNDADTVEIKTLPATSTASPYECRFCQVVVGKIMEEIHNQTNQAEVKKCLEHVCDNYPKSVQSKCKEFVDAYADQIIRYFPSKSPKDLCTKASLCVAGFEQVETATNTEPTKDMQTFSPECTVCEEIIRQVEKQTKSDKSKEHIKEMMEQACAAFPRPDLKQKCHDIVEKNADFIVDSIVNNVDPKEVCKGIALCKDKAVGNLEQVANRFMTKYSETPQCVMCQLIMTQLEARLKDKKNIEEMTQLLRGVCKTFPAKLKSQCDKFVVQYTELIVSLVETIPPKDLCAQIDLCRQKNVDTSQREVLECGVCGATVDALSMVLHKNGPKDRNTVIETTCHLIPANHAEACGELMKIYVESLENLIQAGNTTKACSMIGKCFGDGSSSMFVEMTSGTAKPQTPSEEPKAPIEPEEHVSGNSPPRRLVGTNKCSFGPSYWCSSPEAEKECNARSFCAARKTMIAN